MKIRVSIVFFAVIALSGCAPFLYKEAFDFKTTSLFTKPCEQRMKLEKQAEKERVEKKKGFWAKINPVNLVASSKEEQVKELETTVNDCNVTDLEGMVERFMGIRETDEQDRVLGDTIQQVTEKGFTVYMDKEQKVRRQNTQIYHGNAALAAADLAVSPPTSQNTEEMKASISFLSQHVAWVLEEKGLRTTSDRFYINTKNSLDKGDDYKFVILYRNGRVFKRITKGGPINNPKQEKGFLLGPGDLMIDTVKKGAAAVIPGF